MTKDSKICRTMHELDDVGASTTLVVTMTRFLTGCCSCLIDKVRFRIEKRGELPNEFHHPASQIGHGAVGIVSNINFFIRGTFPRPDGEIMIADGVSKAGEKLSALAG